jgi:Mrp family chromosome partitioning ATPase
VNDLTDITKGSSVKPDVMFRGRSREAVTGDRPTGNPDSSLPRPVANDIWQRLELSIPSARTLNAQQIVSGRSSEPAAVPIAMLRTQMLQTMQAHDFNAFAVASPTPRCGSSFLAVNLAFSMARQRSLRVLLLDLDLSRPALAKRLGVPDTLGQIEDAGISAIPPGKCVRLGDNLVLGYASQPVPRSSEILQDMSDGGVIEQFRRALRPDVIICDTPPVLRSDDLVALAPQLGGVLVVADGQRTTPEDLRKTEALLLDRTRLIGVVLNRGPRA